MKRMSALILVCILVFGMLPFAATPASAKMVGETTGGSWGKITVSGLNKQTLSTGLAVTSNESADEALEEASTHGGNVAVSIMLDHDWTTSHFITSDAHVSIDLNGHTWRITGEDVLDTSGKHISISGGTLIFENTEWSPIRVQEGGDLTIRDVIFRDCHCDECGLIYFTSYSSKLYCENVTFENCYCDGWGGCVYLDAPEKTMGANQRPEVIFKNCDFTSCHAWKGGGVLYSGLKQCDITFEDCFFLFNRSDNYCGGAIYANGDYDTYKFRDCAVYNCYAFDAGGFAFIGGTHNDFIGDPDFNSNDKYNMDTRTTVCGCYATGSGGAIYVSNTAGYGHYFKVNGFNFVQNTAGSAAHTIKSIQSVNANEWGGALCLRGEHAEVERCDFIENYAHYYGGAVYLGDNDSSVKYCVFRDNWSDPNYKGEDIFNDDYYNTISDNIYYSDREDTIYMYYSGTNTNNKHYPKKAGGRLAGLSGSGSESDPWLVTCSRAMLDLAMNVSSGVTYEGKYFLVTKDIPNIYVPIGSSKYPFMGTFDGGDHFFSAYMRSDGNNIGIFGYTKSATIKNVHVKEGFISGVSNVGGISAEANGTTFLNCSNAATVNSKSSGKYVGGIAGLSHGTLRFEKCTNDGKIYGAMEGIGGIAGCLTFIDTGDAYKIIVTDLPVGVFDTCRNNGYVFASAGGGYIAGGIIGEFLGQITFKNCINTGTVEVRDAYAGGIVGQIPAPYVCDTSYIIMNCMNDGKIIAGTSNVGGIVGWSSLRGGTRQILNCANYGEITAPKELGGILTTEYEMPPKDGCGDAFLVDVKNCYGYGGMPHNHNYGAIVAGAGLGNFTNCITNANRPATDSHSTILSGGDVEIKTARQMNLYISRHQSETNGWAYWFTNPVTGLAEPDFRVTVLGAYTGGGTESNPYIIDETSDLRYLENELTQGKSVKGKYFLLKNDIAYTGMPIGDSENPFGGIFDGGGHTITLTIKGANQSGLFSNVSDTEIRNLNITGSVDTQGVDVGAFAGWACRTTFTNCSNSATVVGYQYVAGIAGTGLDCTFIDCTNNGAIESSATDGAGICGSNQGNVTFLRCCNNGAISSAVITAGGIAGVIWQGCTVLSCVNTINGTVNSPTNAGGIIGCIVNESNHTPRVENCANHGNITADSAVGGILHNENPKTVVKNCFSAGTITATSGSGYAAIVQGTNVNHPDCYVMEGIGATDTAAKSMGRSQCGRSLVGMINEKIELTPSLKEEWKLWGLDPTSFFASPLGAEVEITSLEGSGTKEDPYLIKDVNDLIEIGSRVISNLDSAQTHYRLTADIPDYKGAPIGSPSAPFVGVFDGDSYKINLSKMNGGNYVGLFGYVSGGRIENLSVSGEITGNLSVGNTGAVVGYAENAQIINCASTATVYGVDQVGGIAGTAAGSTELLNCYVSATVTATGKNAGGIVGKLCGSSVVRNCIKIETTTGAETVGGIAGLMDGAECAIENCGQYGYTVGTATQVYAIGGILGKATNGGRVFLCFFSSVIEADTNKNEDAKLMENSHGIIVGEKASNTKCENLYYYKYSMTFTGWNPVGNDPSVKANGRRLPDCKNPLAILVNKLVPSNPGFTTWAISAEVSSMACPGNYVAISHGKAGGVASVFAENNSIVLGCCAAVTAAGVTLSFVFAAKKRKSSSVKKGGNVRNENENA